jgi:hypothetical protein
VAAIASMAMRTMSRILTIGELRPLDENHDRRTTTGRPMTAHHRPHR